MAENLVANGLCIRPLRAGDAAALARAAAESLDTVGQWLPWCDEQFALREAEQWVRICAADLAARTAYSMGIFAEDGGDYLGGIGINHINREHNFANLGFWVRASRQNRGIARRAVAMMAEFGLDVLGLDRLEIVVAEHNLASRRVAVTVGARFEGILHNRLLLRGTPMAAAMYSLTRA
ncbi:GNAT family N-acetyltransferase [Rugamonas sp. CCM 8940]|uniref:GNAT family N-acetyltransferase n=1 Tax=Rugamonas sp. CCM 8940 TaxID=2765359 RepID=UPI0018F5A039|nr:GNAT family protein [Rugamonas sp. CCM 8940]MBJ7312902.1 GNAT family N-acetyltransferase [Rugamonas sp. CCM 8940]